MKRRLRFRGDDNHLQGVEDGFNAMMETVEEQAGGQQNPTGDAESAQEPVAPPGA